MSHRRLPVTELESTFKKWIAGQKDLSDFCKLGLDKEDPDEQFVGRRAETAVSENKLLQKVQTEEDPVSIIFEFIENGGIVQGFEGKKVQIEVESGTFMVPRFCVKIQKDEPEELPQTES